MKKETLFTFYADDDIVSSLKEELDIKEGCERFEIANIELPTSPLADQLKDANWSEVGIGRHTLLFYMKMDNTAEDGLVTSSIKKVHVISRHDTKTEIQEKVSGEVKKALTTLNDSGTI